MSSSAIEIQVPAARNVIMSDEALTLELADGRTLSVPLTWYPRLWNGTGRERNYWRLVGGGEGIHWPDLDQDTSFAFLGSSAPAMPRPGKQPTANATTMIRRICRLLLRMNSRAITASIFS